MAEYIEREAAYPLAKKICDAVDSQPRVLLPRTILDLIDDLPAADMVARDCYDRLLAENDELRKVRPVVRGKWIGYPECLKYPNAYSNDHIVCSACEECFSILDNDCERFNFCPNCGADMREES